jgi:hypothetical protein
MSFFREKEKLILKFISNHKNPQIAQAVLNKRNNARGIMILNFTLSYRDTEQK